MTSPNPDEYLAVVVVRLRSTLDRDRLTRQLVVALWDGADETVVTPDGATDELRVTEYVYTVVAPDADEPPSGER